ncbi:MAG: phenylalanine--tRNA ligase subunit beta [Simkaniaceae bacterium]|nr:phenylalanine--tRNA ligase subunit beta [Simkaniaceae bacterium]
MLIPLSWLKKYISTDLPVSTIASTLDLAGIEVDHIHQTQAPFSNVFVAEIQNVIPHPDAEKLKIATVFDGEETLQIVCGAPNCRIGIKTALVKIGGTVGDIKIKKGKLRGVESQGMLCGADELGLSKERGGIIELDLPVGLDFVAHCADTVLEISLTPNLGHCASIFGIARELSTHLNIPLSPPSFEVIEEGPPNELKVSIEDDRCSHYTCRVIDNVKVAPSPEWLSSYLEKGGIRSINNIVDITNYVMLELGQPLHAFDIKGIDEIYIGKASRSLKTLDGVEREIPTESLMIKSQDKPLAFAGIIGGLDSGVTDSTTTIILESARFDPIAIRLGSKALSIRTESSGRFEKGIDPLGVVKALNRAASLIREIAGGTVRQGIQETLLKPYTPNPILYRTEKINALLGTSFSHGEIEHFLKRLDFHLTGNRATPPSYRNDIRAEIDIIEEIARLYGYNRIPRSTAAYTPSQIPHAHLYLIESRVRQALIGAGLQEFLTCNLISPLLANIPCEKSLSSDDLVTVKHPTSLDQSVLRPSLLPGLLQSLKRNQDQRLFNVSAFEIGRIHFKDGEHYKERATVGILLAGAQAPAHFTSQPRSVDFFDLKGILQNLLENFNLSPLFTPSQLTTFHPGIQATFSSFGSLGKVHPEHLQKLGIEGDAFYAEIDLHDLSFPKKQMAPLPIYPGSTRDITLLVDKTTPLDFLLNKIKQTPSQLLKGVELIAIYENPSLGVDKHNLTLRFTYRHDQKTISHEVVEKEHERISNSLL